MYHPKAISNRVRNILVVMTLVALAATAAILTMARLPGAAWSSQEAAVPAANQNASVILPSHQIHDLGAGYVLESDAQGSRIVPPPSLVRPSAPSKSIDLGAGYTLELNAAGGQIVPPATTFKPQPFASKTVDLGAGYTLKLDANGGTIIAPANPVKAQNGVVTRQYLGAGYWLVVGPDGGHIEREGSR